jgi:hypothetical protein
MMAAQAVARSWMSAAATWHLIGSPSVSTPMCLLRAFDFVAAIIAT